MREEIMEGIRRHIIPLTGIEKAEILEISPGHSKIFIEIGKESLNLYGNLHGGFIFSLCDIASGMATYAYEYENVTQHGDISFLKGTNSGKIFIEANALHKGKRSVINKVELTSENGVLLATGTFTMYLLKPILPKEN